MDTIINTITCIATVMSLMVTLALAWPIISPRLTLRRQQVIMTIRNRMSGWKVKLVLFLLAISYTMEFAAPHTITNVCLLAFFINMLVTVFIINVFMSPWVIGEA